MITVLDVVVPGAGEHWPKLAPVLAETDVFLPNADEAELITGLTIHWPKPSDFGSAGPAQSSLRKAMNGATLVSDKLRLHVGVYPTEFVGATGSGDAFDAGFIAGLLAGCNPLGCLKWGAALGASCVRSLSATESVFNREQAEDFMRRHELPVSVL